ncbi:MAG: SlyX family protein [Pseudomonadota bacterium]
MSDLETRLQNLEELCSHQGREIESLSEQLAEQWTQIDGLTKSLLRFRDRLMEMEEAGSGPHEITKPPHY